MFDFWMETDLRSLPEIPSMHGVTFTQDSGDNKVGVIVTENGIPATLTGTVRAWIILPTGETIQEDGEKDGNRAWVILPDETYEQEGPISVFIKLINGTETATLGGVEAYVYKSR